MKHGARGTEQERKERRGVSGRVVELPREGAGGVPEGVVPPQLQHVFWVSKLCFLYSALSPPSMLLSRWRDLCWLGARSSRSESALDSIKVARCTSVSAVSHIMSLTCRCWDYFDGKKL